MSQLIDIEAAREFMRETLEKVDPEHLSAIAYDLEQKSAYFKDHLEESELSSMTEKGVTDLMKAVFATRRKYGNILEQNTWEDLKAHISTLLHSELPVEKRFQDFVDRLGDVDKGMKCELAGELLHFYNPEKYWMWSRWMWDPKNKTGALPLVTTEGFDLLGESEGETYLKVGKAVAFVHSVAEPAEFQFISRTLFGTDVYLSCVYVVYAYTVLRLRMTQEFNKVMPGLVEFARRILGVYKMPETV